MPCRSRNIVLRCPTGSALRRSASTTSTPLERPGAATAPQQMELNGVLRLQHRPDRRYLVGLVGDEMDQHVMPIKKAFTNVHAAKFGIPINIKGLMVAPFP